jgi:hypothetical protein
MQLCKLFQIEHRSSTSCGMIKAFSQRTIAILAASRRPGRGRDMVKRKPLQTRWQALLDITSISDGARLPPAVPADRRNVAGRHALLHRIHSEFEEMPGMSLTLSQAAKLFGLPSDVASRILHGLTDARVLHRRTDGRFSLREEP